jgi:S1-C subfamily serine protease
VTQGVYNAVKAATVAVALFHPNNPGSKNRPFTIIGSGFCIHSAGVVITCEHVYKTFIDPAAYELVLNDTNGTRHELRGAVPHVIFYIPEPIGSNFVTFPVPIENAITKTDFDLAAFKLAKHGAFRNGYPVLSIAKYESIHEMMEVATCGFPLGENLEEQIGTITSSFTRGMISSIIPAAGVDIEHLRGFQLDLTATNGNSGGPVFSLATGEVFGVLQAGVVHPGSGHQVHGLVKAEPVYPILANNLVDRLLKSQC